MPARTLTVDCGGTGLKAVVLDEDGAPLSERVRIPTPYPCPPDVLVAALARLVEPLPPYDRVSVGFPGVLRAGRVLTTPHYVTEAGPFTPLRDDLLRQWRGYDVAAALAETLARPTIAVNDAELHGLAVVCGQGYEVMLTLGTGLGFAQFWNGELLPKVEMSAHPFAKGETYDERLGDHARRAVGNARWNRRVRKAVRTLQRTFWWDAVYIGGGNSRHLDPELGVDAAIVTNAAGLLGGVRLWRGE
ncbi:MAG: ROK family protein [Actinomycetota bacterium]|nr:ROK family protein [Actinomycetota bacterium]